MAEKRIGDVLKTRRRQLKFPVAHVITELENLGITIKSSTLYAYENNQNIPDGATLVALCQVYSIADILSEFGYAADEKELSNEALKIAALYDDTEQKIRDIIKFALYYDPEKQRQSMLDNSQKHYMRAVPLPPPIEDEPEPEEYTVYEMPASAGLGNYLDADPPSEQYIFPAGTVPPGTDFGVRISGDSMEPTIADGSIVFVEECLELRNGEIGIFSLDGEAYCKELYVDRERQEVRLISRNEDYEPITVTINEYTDLRTVGRVLGWWAEE